MSAVVDIAATAHRPPSLTMFSSAVVHHCKSDPIRCHHGCIVSLSLSSLRGGATPDPDGDNDDDENEDDEDNEDDADHPPPTGIANNNSVALAMENGATGDDYNEEAV